MAENLFFIYNTNSCIYEIKYALGAECFRVWSRNVASFNSYELCINNFWFFFLVHGTLYSYKEEVCVIIVLILCIPDKKS